jgi:hypothetical protein
MDKRVESSAAFIAALCRIKTKQTSFSCNEKASLLQKTGLKVTSGQNLNDILPGA